MWWDLLHGTLRRRRRESGREGGWKGEGKGVGKGGKVVGKEGREGQSLDLTHLAMQIELLQRSYNAGHVCSVFLTL